MHTCSNLLISCNCVNLSVYAIGSCYVPWNGMGFCCWHVAHTVYPKKYAHGFVVLCFVVVMQSFIINSHDVFIHIHQGCFAGTGTIVRLPQCQWSKPDGYGKISQCITATKHSKAKTVCRFFGIYCIFTSVLLSMEYAVEIVIKEKSKIRDTIGHYSDVIMSAMANSITGVPVVCSTICSSADQRKHQSSVLLAGLCEGKLYITTKFVLV